MSAIAGAAIGYLALWAVYHGFRLLTGKEGMGYGDFKLLAALGAWLGWQMLLPIVLLSARRRRHRRHRLILTRRAATRHSDAVRPFLAAAGWIAHDVGSAARGALPGAVRPARLIRPERRSDSLRSV